jgi:glycine cleavage system H protein
VLEVNEALSTDPALVNTSPYEQGWLYKVKLANPAQIDALKDAAAYRSQIGS